MPRYELMYILSSAVSDDQVPEVATQVTQFVTDFGGTDAQATDLGKKKLAYPIKKTRNGFYGLVNFTMPTDKINEFDAKIRTQDNTIIRYLIVNLEEHLTRSARDTEIQAKMAANRPPQMASVPIGAEPEPPPVKPAPRPKPVTAAPKAPKVPMPEMNAEELDKKIEEALNEEIIP
jgi:small subunit ribosomal protein S6